MKTHHIRNLRYINLGAVMLMSSVWCQENNTVPAPIPHTRLWTYITAVNPHYWYSPMKQKVSQIIKRKTVEERIQHISMLLTQMHDVFSTQSDRALHGASASAREAYHIIASHVVDHESQQLHPVIAQWLSGHDIAQKIFKGENPPATYEAVNAVATYLYALATREVDHPLDDFTLVMIDEAHVTTETGALAAPIKKLYDWFKQSTACYKRISTHFSHCSKQQFGLDLTARTSATSGAPTKKLHLLFGELDNNMFFFKLEAHGLRGARHFIMHSGGYIVSRIRKVSLLRTMFRVVPDDHASFRNEVVPHLIMNIFKELLILIEPQAAQRSVIMKRAKSHGIREMLQLLKTHAATHTNASVVALIDTFIAHLTTMYEPATITVRIGHEIICTAQQLLAPENHA